MLGPRRPPLCSCRDAVQRGSGVVRTGGRLWEAAGDRALEKNCNQITTSMKGVLKLSIQETKCGTTSTVSMYTVEHEKPLENSMTFMLSANSNRLKTLFTKWYKIYLLLSFSWLKWLQIQSSSIIFI